MTAVRHAMEDVSFGSLRRSRRLPLRFLDSHAYRAELFKPAHAVDSGTRTVGGEVMLISSLTCTILTSAEAYRTIPISLEPNLSGGRGSSAKPAQR
jgi:hypothetical protein